MTHLWQVSTTEYGGNTESLMRRANVYQIANGAMGCRGTLDEHGPEESVGVTLAGIWDRVGSAWREPVNAPNGAFTRAWVDGQPLFGPRVRVRSHRQTLHFANAMFERETAFAARNKEVVIRSKRILSVESPGLGLVQYSVRCTRAAEVTLRTGIDGEIWDLNGPHLPRLELEKRGSVLLTHGRTHELGRQVAVAESVVHDLGPEAHEAQARCNVRVLRFRAQPGRTYTLVKFFAVAVGDAAPGASACEAALAVVDRARAAGLVACRAAHDAAWARRWESCDVSIEGDPLAQLGLRYSLLQLLMVAPVAGSATSIPARALSGQVYKGAVFWDTEMFMLPFFLHTYPEKAVELLRYRIRTLDGARRKARAEGPGFRGAFYAWESQDTGDDACEYFNIGDPFTGRALRTHFRDKQVHISGDVAMALWAHFTHTGDDTLLLEGGAEVILECARFYASYAYYKPDKARFEILDVVGPDEYHERVNNNAFTNAVVKETFAIALAVVTHLRRRHPAVLAALLRRLGMEREIPEFRRLARHLYVPQPDPASGVIEQFDAYFRLRDATVAELKGRMVHPNEYLGAGQGLAVPTQVIKQADVVMMLALFRERFPAAIKQANWAYYEPRTEHGSSLSACAYAMVAAEFGDLDFAYEYFLKTALIDLEAKYKVYVGTVFMGGSHPAANGGAWMTAIFGFAGLRVDARGITLEPRLPARWKRLAFRLTCRGDAFAVTITRETVRLVPEADNRADHTVFVAGREVTCHRGRPIEVRYARAVRVRRRTVARTRVAAVAR